ncbi:hypothetical protein LGM46_28365 [Burkholderia arboris]|uniref:hypothetical protein n=1 Tax=Burkholderia arboris TaxID=488730 RepID=UPI001CF2F09F|nr:hypothetical protein [Burkholderia arboris]MCA8036889.1 hypothetical protein [Burkholderia arboris]
MKIDHSIDGGVFSLDDYVLIIFGLPFAMDRRFPQVSYPSIYLIGRGVRAVGEGFMGGGVYDAEFSGDRKFIVINIRFGVEVMDVEKEGTHSFDVMYVPGFEIQKM